MIINYKDWSENFDICNVCETSLNTTFEFHQLCLMNKSLTTYCETTKPKIKIEIDSERINCEYSADIVANKQQLIRKHPSVVKTRSNKPKTNGIILNKKSSKKAVQKKHLTSTKMATSGHIDGNCTGNGNNDDESQYQCEICLKCFRFASTLRRHLHRGHSSSPNIECDFKCEHCSDGKQYQTISGLKYHLSHTHGIRPDKTRKTTKIKDPKSHQCKICLRSFYKAYRLKQHLHAVHLDICDYKCEQCSEQFKNNVSLQGHLGRVHGGTLKYKCTECAKSFPVSSRLQEHLRVHSSECAFKCEHCDREYKTKQGLNYHLKSVHCQ